ncbi:substrate-binding domain-containing protein kinase family protein [Vasconcelosia minhoensis]|uniref:hypothetical protein n=1 Tax=Vasconcelosia minhoensis TaxID=3366354 RepID=UPI0018806456|nr:hypothetical protein [Romeria gracilis]
MPVGHLTKRVLRRYLLQLPPQRRIGRYHALSKLSWLKSALEEIRPEVLPEPAPSDIPVQAAIPEAIQAPSPHYHQYRCLQGSPLSCLEPANSGQARCEYCGFPAFLPGQGQLVGKQGQYQIGHPLGRRGISRLYDGLRLGAEEPVVIHEYLLPERYFSPAEQRQYQEAFTSLAGLALADGRMQDLRIVTPLEAIADPSGDRCYLITPAVDCSPTLNRYCAEHGPFSGQAVVDMLNQVLQTLTFLHQQKFRLPSGQVQTGIVHGNLSLDSLLWVESHRQADLQGFVYLADLAQWATRFDPALVNRGEADPQQDLAALGQIAFYLLNGATVNQQGQPLNPRLDGDWPTALYAPLQLFIRRLIGVEPPFVSAEVARMALLKLPPEAAVSQWELRQAEILTAHRSGYRPYVPLLIAAAVVAALASITWLLLRSRQPSYANSPLPPCCFADIGAVPTGRYPYASPEFAYWHPLIQTSLDTSTLPAPPLFNQLQARYPDLTLIGRSTPTAATAIAAIQSGQAEFAILPLIGPLPADITATIIAYDSLVPVVAFNYPDRTKGLTDALDGEVSLPQLKQLYTGQISNWQQISPVDLSVNRYGSNDPTVQAIFQQQVDFYPAETAAFPSLEMLRLILQDFENDTTGSIGIAPLSQVVGQCSVYPLALSVENEPVSPLILDNGNAVEPDSDLCDRKGSYHPNAAAIRSGSYPLAYPLAVVYPFDNTRSNIGSKLASLLLTQESQQYLMTMGLVSAYPLELRTGAEQ